MRGKAKRRLFTAALAAALVLAGSATELLGATTHHRRKAARKKTAAMAATTSAAPTATSGPPSAPRSLDITCPSPALGGTLPTLVSVPAGYDSSPSRRYRVIYFLHGLPATRSTYAAYTFLGNAVARGTQAAIVVAPQGARRDGDDREYLDWGPKENWPLAISHDLTACIDSHFRTVAGRTGRALVGLSAGGYGAFDIGLRNLATFGAVESWSGYFMATDPSGLKDLDLGSPEANDLARVPQGAQLKAALAAEPAFVGFYVGNEDSRFYNPNLAYDAALTQIGVSHTFRVYQAGHAASLWRAEASVWLGYAVDALLAGR